MTETSIVPAQAAPLQTHGLNPEQVDLIKRTICAGATNDELALFIAICNRTGLDPFSKQIYAIRRTSKGVSRMVIQTGIDGYRAIADRQNNYAGSDEPLFNDGQTEYQMLVSKAPILTATVTVYKVVSGVRCPFTATANWDSYCPVSGQDSMWQKFPFLMLAKCAEALALRKGWATQLSGLYTDAEMQQSGKPEYVEVAAETPSDAPGKPKDAPKEPIARGKRGEPKITPAPPPYEPPPTDLQPPEPPIGERIEVSVLDGKEAQTAGENPRTYVEWYLDYSGLKFYAKLWHGVRHKADAMFTAGGAGYRGKVHIVLDSRMVKGFPVYDVRDIGMQEPPAEAPAGALDDQPPMSKGD
jgi:phage recombination protein Bet